MRDHETAAIKAEALREHAAWVIQSGVDPVLWRDLDRGIDVRVSTLAWDEAARYEEEVRQEGGDDYAEPEYVDCTCGHPNDDHGDGECPFLGCGCGAFYDEDDDCQHEWELRSEHDLWVCAWCSAEVTAPPAATPTGDADA